MSNVLRARAVAAVVTTALAISIAEHAPVQQFPFGTQHQAYRSGTLMPSNHTRSAMNGHVTADYDYWKARWLKQETGSDRWHVWRNSTGRTVSEGQGYGMVIVPLMAGHDPQAKTIFDGLWQFRLAHPSVIDNRLMDWQHPNEDPDEGDDSAFDGDADIAYGLLLAHAQWGSGGTINYLQQAKNVIAGIKAETIGPTSRLPLLGDWVSPTSTGTYSQWTTRSSDFMPGHFRAYGAAANDAAYWNSVVTATQSVVTNIQANESAATGLLPDFIRLAGPSHDPQPAEEDFLEGEHDGDYWYNAGRDPWRLGVDAILNGDPTTLTQVRKLSTWARTSTGGVPNNIGSGYLLNGTSLDTGENHFYIAPFAVAAMSGSSPSNTAADQTWLNSLYDRIRGAHSTHDYYADVVTLQVLLAVTGNMWDPMTVLTRLGDYDFDGTTDADDYLIWRTSFGSTTASHADGNGNGIVDAADYVVWRNHFVTSAADVASIPKPVAWQILVPLALIAFRRSWWRFFTRRGTTRSGRIAARCT